MKLIAITITQEHTLEMQNISDKLREIGLNVTAVLQSTNVILGDCDELVVCKIEEYAEKNKDEIKFVEVDIPSQRFIVWN